MATEFKISRLRFNWAGAWGTTTFYNRDAVVQYQGKTYVCLVPHTSANFYDDLNKSDIVLGPTPYWTLMLDGKIWKQDWQPNTYYGLGNIVRYGGVVYVCVTPHTSGAQQITAVNWITYSVFDNWNNAWTSNTVYGVGDVVKYGGIIYRCIVNHVSAASVYGLEVDQGLDSAAEKWEVVNYGYEYKGDWDPTNYRYKLNDIVKNGPDLWFCNNGHTSSSIFDISKWDIYIPGLEFVSTWDQLTVYQPSDIVIYGGYSYRSITPNNQGNVPSTEAAEWEIVTEGYSIRNEWLQNTSYKIGEIVRRHGNLFVATQDNNSDPTNQVIVKAYRATGSSGTTIKISTSDSSAGNILPGMIVTGPGFTRGQTVVSHPDDVTVILNEAPDGTPIDASTISFNGINYIDWELVVPGVSWRGFWQAGISYIIGDLVIWANGTYRCISNHPSSLEGNNPEVDISRNFWAVYTLHDRNNALKNQGDILYRNSTTNLPLAIVPTPVSPLTETPQLLQIFGQAPSWQTTFITPKVFYVTTNGIDSAERGKTWDQAWATVKYACEYIMNGTVYQDTRDILVANKNFMVEEMWQWMQYQMANTLSPYSPSSVFDEDKTRRDAEYVIDALIYDITRGGNSQTVATALAYFAPGSTTSFVNATVAAEMPYFYTSLAYLQTLIISVVNKADPAVNYQTANEIDELLQIVQVKTTNYITENGVVSLLTSLSNYIITALTNQTTAGLPEPNQGLTATVYVKSGTYYESLPIVVPANTAIVGDELRGTVIQPSIVINTIARTTEAGTNLIKVDSTVGMYDGCPVQFVSTGTTIYDFAGLTSGTTFYVVGDSITSTHFAVSQSPGTGLRFDLSTDPSGTMYVYGGDAINDMFYLQNGTGLRNMTLNGLLGTLSAANIYLTQRPTGGAYASLDPGTGPDDTSAWIYRRSPYVQNVTTFGIGCVGCKIDGTLHNGGNKSIVSNDFTQILSDGIGVWCTGSGSLTECVSVFSYYNYCSYFAEDGGRIRATNGNSSYGTYGVIAEGYDATETPISGNITNQLTEAQASVQSSFGVNSILLRLQYSNAGVGYNNAVTNMIKNSNNFLSTWSTDGNVTLTQNITSPNGLSDGWSFTGIASGSTTSYVYQDIAITPTGGTYTNIGGSNISGSGTGATFDITVTATAYTAIINASNTGNNYIINNQILILGSVFGGVNGTNDLTLTVATLTGTAIATVTASGTVPSGAAMTYGISVYAKQNTATSFEVDAIFTGTSTRYSIVNYNFTTDTVTPSNESGGMTPTSYGRQVIGNGWYRVYFSVYDTSGLNNNLQIRIYPRGRTGSALITNFFGAQVEINDGSSIGFYLETLVNRYTANANYKITGAGTGALVVADEIRSDAIYQVRVTGGGTNYLTASNQAQGGTTEYVAVAQSDVNTAANYQRMRLFITSGTGAGQYGYITFFNPTNKYAYIAKDSFNPLTITAATGSSTNTLTLAATDTTTLYLNQPVQFIPTYYTTTISQTSQAMQSVSQTIGGQVNQITVQDSSLLYVNMQVSFSGTTFGGVITGYVYYIVGIIDGTHIQISAEGAGGTVLLLNTASGSMTLLYPASNNYLMASSTTNMAVNMPIQFTGTSIGGIGIGTVYYINDVVDSTTFTISAALVTVTASATTALTKLVTVDSTSNLTALNPIYFTGTTFGGIAINTKYYVSKITSGTKLTLASSLITTTATITTVATSTITVGSTTGFVADNPIQFIGNTFGNLTSGQTYYISAIDAGSNTITVSTTIGGSAFPVQAGVGSVIVKTTAAAITLTDSVGTLTGTTTTVKSTITSGVGTLTGTFYTTVFGGVQAGTTYYVYAITPGSPSTIQLTGSSGGSSAISLTTGTGSMQLAEIGWDHVNMGTQPITTLDSTTQYFIEPRITVSTPAFTQTSMSPIPLSGATWNKIAYGNNYWLAIPTSGATIMRSTNGTIWSSLIIPSGSNFKGIAYGNKYWVVITDSTSLTDSGSKVYYSNSNGTGWNLTYLPSKTTWSHIAYGNGVFVAIAAGTSTAAYSLDHGKTWSSASGLSSATWTGLAYGAGTFLAISSGGTTGAVSTTGTSWSSSTLPISTNWSAVAYGRGRFVITSSSATTKAGYSFDGTTWYTSKTTVRADNIAYGNGVFVAVYSGGTTGYTSESGETWTTRTVTNDSYSAITFGRNSSNKSVFVTLASIATGSTITAGAMPKARATLASGTITAIGVWETGSGYTSDPTITITDPNIYTSATTTVRKGDGVLSGPTFISRGTGYNTNSTTVTITGDGYADEYQTGLGINMVSLTKLPQPGDNLVINGNDNIYKVTSATALYGTTAPSITATVQIAPEMTVALSPAHATSISIRQQYSQARLTNHDFLNVGYGNRIDSNYPNLPTNTELSAQNQTVENNYGRVFYTSTDQDGNFKVGTLFGVEQATGIVTLSASQFGLSGLDTLSLGGISVGGSSVVVSQFSTDPTFIANSNNIIPTQKAIRSYLTSRLTQGGSNTFTGQLTAGTVVVGGADKISNTIPAGTIGSSVKMAQKVRIFGATGGIGGNMPAFFMFSNNFVRRGI
jgi:hypothetical protein